MLLCAKCGSQVETGVVLHEDVISVYLHWALTWRVQVVRVILCWPCYRHQHRVAMSRGWKLEALELEVWKSEAWKLGSLEA